VSLVYHILKAIWARAFGGGITDTQEVSPSGRASRRQPKVSALARKKTSPIFINVERGMVYILAHCVGPNAKESVDQIRVELDGKLVLPKVTKLPKEDGSFMLAVNGCGGWIKISLLVRKS
jgi:hypothetical protein